LDSLVNYTCSFGYRVVGSKVRICKEDGKWSDSSPKCEEIRCVPPEVPKNSSVVYSGNDRSTSDSFKVGSTVQYRCATGHIVRGESYRTCDPDGSWSGSPPSCQYVDCGWPYIIPHGRWILTTNTTHYGSTVEYECTGNFRISNGPPRRLCLENGTWSGTAPVCETISCPKPMVKDDKTIVEGAQGAQSGSQLGSFLVGDKIRYSCSYGYELVGEETHTCEPSGRWSHDVPHCRVVDCGRPAVLPNGRGYLLNSSTTYDSVIEYHCIPEFKLVGDPIRRCLATGSWSGSLPRCLEMSVINEMSENDIDSRADSSQSINGSPTSAIHSNVESSKAIGIGIAIGIGALLVLIMTVAVVCLKAKKAHPVKGHNNGHHLHNNHHHHHHTGSVVESHHHLHTNGGNHMNGHHHLPHHHHLHGHSNGHAGGNSSNKDGTTHSNGAIINGGSQSMVVNPAIMSYSRLSLESEAAASANHMLPSGGSIRHHPNGLVTFCPPNGHRNNNGGNSNNSNQNANTTTPLQLVTSYPLVNSQNHHHNQQHNNLTKSTGNGDIAVSGSTVSVAIRPNHRAASPALSLSSSGPVSPSGGGHQVMTNGRAIMSTTMTMDV